MSFWGHSNWGRLLEGRTVTGPKEALWEWDVLVLIHSGWVPSPLLWALGSCPLDQKKGPPSVQRNTVHPRSDRRLANQNLCDS